MSEKRYVPEVSMLGGEVDYAALSKMSVPAGESVLPAEPGPVEKSIMSKLSGRWATPGFIPSVWMCMACGEMPAQSRDESVVVLCEDCAAYVFGAAMAEMSEMTFITPYARHQAVYAKMTETYGYAMVDAELSKMFD